MPEREHMKEAVPSLVVDEVPDATEEKAAHTRGSRAFIFGTDARLFSQQSHGLAEVRCDGTRSGGAVHRPPLRCLADLTCCAGGDPDPKRHTQLCIGRDCRSSSRDKYSPRSISAMAASSSFS